MDFDELGEDEIRALLENTRYPNHALEMMKVVNVQSKELGEWEDDHPLNSTDEKISAAARNKLFKWDNCDADLLAKEVQQAIGLELRASS